jgi:hypothetical protein
LAGKPTLMTRSSATLSLFSEPSVSPRQPSAIALSIMAHAAVVAFAYFALTHLPRIEDPSLRAHYSVRQLDLHALDPKFPNMPQSAETAESKIPYPGRDALDEISGGVPPELAQAMRTFIGSAAGRQTLIQPAIHSRRSFSEQVPLPTMMIWKADVEQRKKIIPPPPNPSAASDVIPSIEAPNQETTLANISVTATDVPPPIQAMPAGSTSPLKTESPKPVQLAPSTTSALLDEPSSIAVLSISDVRMPDGTVIVPPVNDIRPEVSEKIAGGAHDSGSPKTGNEAKREDTDEGAIDGQGRSTEHIVMPRDGKFNVVVAGSSLEEQYPETAELWANRMAYTAYLHVGLKKNWILQYSLTRGAEAANAGRVARLEAPWPYDILRPNLLARDLNGDALMVHGVLNKAGHFESLAIAFPSSFRYASFVLRALRQWQFRPAQQNGEATAVEVLLIIPEELD